MVIRPRRSYAWNFLEDVLVVIQYAPHALIHWPGVLALILGILDVQGVRLRVVELHRAILAFNGAQP
ncbi:MAG: hypothetical protein ACRDL7_07945, partial [Gaiellaceae bacterium]